jgi:hypothetical protein
MTKHTVNTDDRALCIIALRVCIIKRKELELPDGVANAMEELCAKLDPDNALGWALSAVMGDKK